MFRLLLFTAILLLGAHCYEYDFDPNLPLENHEFTAFPLEECIKMAHQILETLEQTVGSLDNQKLLDLYAQDVEFSQCAVSGHSSVEFRDYLESEAFKKIAKSNHTIRAYPGSKPVEMLDVHGFRFNYDVTYLMRNDEVSTSDGTIIVRTENGKIEIVKAFEQCPKKVL